MSWRVYYHPAFAEELRTYDQRVRIALVGALDAVERYGPVLGRPMADTLKGSRFANMKEMRVSIFGEPWRVAFAFDPARRAVVLVAGSKAGTSQSLFYRGLIRVADKRFADILRI
jgi:hypothetical protein